MFNIFLFYTKLNIIDMTSMHKNEEVSSMNEPHSDNKKLAARLDIMPMAVSLALILALCLAFFLVPEQSKHVLDSVRFFIGEEFGVYYLAVGLGIFPHLEPSGWERREKSRSIPPFPGGR